MIARENLELKYKPKNCFRRSSKGVSPVVAMVFLIATTISVAALMPSWMTGL